MKTELYQRLTAGHATHGQSAIYADDGKTVAIVYDGKEYAAALVHRYNVNADLLEALKATMTRLGELCIEGAITTDRATSRGIDQDLDQARAAIAKAEGGAS